MDQGEAAVMSDQLPQNWSRSWRTLEQAIGETVGAASMCWTKLTDGVFESERASALVDELRDWILARYGEKATAKLSDTEGGLVYPVGLQPTRVQIKNAWRVQDRWANGRFGYLKHEPQRWEGRRFSVVHLPETGEDILVVESGIVPAPETDRLGRNLGG
jgi:hypothetical protein